MADSLPPVPQVPDTNSSIWRRWFDTVRTYILDHIGLTRDINYEPSTGGIALGNKFIWDGSGLTINGTITATSGDIAGWSIDPGLLRSTASVTTGIILNSATNVISVAHPSDPTKSITLDGTTGKLTATDVDLSGSTSTLQIGPDANSYIHISTNGIVGVDNILGTVFNIPLDGSAPTFSSGVINETVFNIVNQGVIRTSQTVGDGATAGVLINDTGVKLFSATSTTPSIYLKNDGTATFTNSLGQQVLSYDGTNLSVVGSLTVQNPTAVKDTLQIPNGSLQGASSLTDAALTLTGSVSAGFGHPSGLPWGSKLPYSRHAIGYSGSTIGTEIGPYGSSELVWQCTTSNGTGGWNGNYMTEAMSVDRDKTYRVIQVFKSSVGVANDGYILLGAMAYDSSGNVTPLTRHASGADQSNIYFNAWISRGISELNTTDWYMSVGYIYPESYTGPTLGKIYNLTTGLEVPLSSTIYDYRWKATVDSLAIRGGMYGSTTIGEQVVLRNPMVHAIDGTEPTLESLISAAVSNANISLSADGTLSGAGGGKVDIFGLGFSGDQGSNLVFNGSAQSGTNQNFSQFNYTTVTPVTGAGCFSATGTFLTVTSDRPIIVDPVKTYHAEVDARADDTQSTYLGVACYDDNGTLIPQHADFYSVETTTASAAYNTTSVTFNAPAGGGAAFPAGYPNPALGTKCFLQIKCDSATFRGWPTTGNPGTPNLLLNGDFATDTSNWTPGLSTGNGSVAWNAAGSMDLVSTGVSNQGIAYQGFTTVVGEKYVASMTVVTPSADSTSNFMIGTSGGDGSLAQTVGIGNVAAIHTLEFVATATTTYVTISGPDSNNTLSVDNLSVERYNAHGDIFEVVSFTDNTDGTWTAQLNTGLQAGRSLSAGETIHFSYYNSGSYNYVMLSAGTLTPTWTHYTGTLSPQGTPSAPQPNTTMRYGTKSIKFLALLNRTSASTSYIDNVYIGDVARGADVTASNTAAGIAGQGALATQSSVDLATSDVINKSLANVDATANTKLSGIAAGADVTASNTAAGIIGQGALATQSSVDLATTQVVNKSLANVDATANTKLGGISAGADVTQAALIIGTQITGGGVELNGGGSVRTVGKTFDDGTSGVLLGWDTDDYKLEVNNATTKNSLLWDGSSLDISGTVWLGDPAAASTLSTVATAGDTTLNVVDTSGFPVSGHGYVLSSAGSEFFYWSNKTATTLTGVTLYSTTHPAGATVIGGEGVLLDKNSNSILFFEADTFNNNSPLLVASMGKLSAPSAAAWFGNSASNTPGVIGQSNGGIGVFGTSSLNYGLYGYSTNAPALYLETLGTSPGNAHMVLKPWTNGNLPTSTNSGAIIATGAVNDPSLYLNKDGTSSGWHKVSTRPASGTYYTVGGPLAQTTYRSQFPNIWESYFTYTSGLKPTIVINEETHLYVNIKVNIASSAYNDQLRVKVAGNTTTITSTAFQVDSNQVKQIVVDVTSLTGAVNVDVEMYTNSATAGWIEIDAINYYLVRI